MARTVQDARLESRTARAKLPLGPKPHWRSIDQGRHLGYRRGSRGGTWVARRFLGAGKYAETRLGIADDVTDADGVEVLSFTQAQAAARAWFAGEATAGLPAPRSPITVAEAIENYVAGLNARNPRSATDTRQRLARHFLPKFGNRSVASLTKTDLDQWRDQLAATPPGRRQRVDTKPAKTRNGIDATLDDDGRRKRRDSANRVLSMIKAAFNHAMQDPENGITDDRAWRLVKAFRDVGKAREVHFSVEEARRLIHATTDPYFADLLRAGFLSGARYGELAVCSVRDFDRSTMTLRVPSGKTGARTVILSREGSELFERLAKGRDPSAPLLSRADGSRWGRSHQARPMRDALEKAGLDQAGTFYALRHSHISRAIEGGVPLTVVAENCGTSVRMIEKSYAKMIANRRREFIEAGTMRISADSATVIPIRSRTG
jgi:integrase